MYDHDPLGRINIPAVRFFSRWASRLVASGLWIAGIGCLVLFAIGEQDTMTARAWVVLPAVALLLTGAAFLVISKSKLMFARS